jgi:prepilin-type processing-associated H-X9-DG protein
LNEQLPPSQPAAATRPKTNIPALAKWALTIIGLALAGVILLPAVLLSVQDWVIAHNSKRAECLSNMKRIGIAIAMYADSHDGLIPRTFDDLRPYATNLDKLLICPSAKGRSHPSYQILLGGKKWNGSETIDAIVMTEPMSNHHGSGHNQLYGDGHVAWSNVEGP